MFLLIKSLLSSVMHAYFLSQSQEATALRALCSKNSPTTTQYQADKSQESLGQQQQKQSIERSSNCYQVMNYESKTHKHRDFHYLTNKFTQLFAFTLQIL